MSRVASITLSLALCVCPLAAQAQTRPAVDGVYGRFDGDTTLSLEALGSFAPASDAIAGAVSVAGRVRFLETMGAALGYDRVFSRARADALWFAVELRPLWLARFTYDYERGPRWLDLMVDSIGLELGGAWLRPGEPIRQGGGFGFVLGAGVEIPLVWSRGDGIMLRLGARWITAHAGDPQGTGARDALVEIGAGLVFRTLVRTGAAGRFQ